MTGKVASAQIVEKQGIKIMPGTAASARSAGRFKIWIMLGMVALALFAGKPITHGKKVNAEFVGRHEVL